LLRFYDFLGYLKLTFNISMAFNRFDCRL